MICLVPFLNKAFNIDEPLFIWTAKHILKEPSNFYGFKINWYGTTEPMSNIMKNPPLTCYFIAPAGKFFGFNEVSLHAVFILPAIAAAAGVYYLGVILCSQPILAALAAILTPGFLVSSTNIMCDTMMLAFWIWAVFFWIKGMKEKNALNLFFAAILTGVCAMTKYFGMSLLGLLFVYSVVRERKIGKWALFLLIPITILAGYQLLTYIFYGRGFLSDAASYATSFKWREGLTLFRESLTGLSFTGGCILTILFYIPLLYPRRFIISLGLLVILLIVALNFVGKIGGFSVHSSDGMKWDFAIQFSVLVAAGTGVLGLAVMDFWEHRDADSLLLLLWMFGTFIFASLLNWTINARSVLPMIPAAGILLARRLERRNKGKQRTNKRRILWPMVPAAIIALLVCWADYTLANSARTVAKAIHEKFANQPGVLRFEGHWGFQYYMETAGGVAFDLESPVAYPGDIIVIPMNNTNTCLLPEELLIENKSFQFDLLPYIGTMCLPLGAGFYSDLGGPLPFAIGTVEPETYLTFTVKLKGT
jgi:4-amino-4-deoxy-L-arabinose transferase-like glycosyltransferase